MDALVKGRNNNFNLVRFCAAFTVIFGHSLVLRYGLEYISPFEQFWGVRADRMAVNAFFILSGFLVTKSMLTRASIIDYMLARGLRVFPGIAVMCLVMAFGLGLAMTTLPAAQYLLDWQTFKFVIVTSLTTVEMVHLPGVFENNVVDPNTVNLPLWTIKYELTAYLGLLCLWIVGIAQKRKYFNWVCVGILAVQLIYMLGLFLDIGTATQLPAIAQSLLRFSFNFLLGAWIYQNRDYIKLKGLYVLVLFVPCILVRATAIFPLISSITLAYGLFWFAAIPSEKLQKFNKFGDYSYGLYIYHFPVTQALLAFAPDMKIGVLIVSASTLSIIMAVISWHFVESPALRAYPRIANYVHDKLNTKATGEIIRRRKLMAGEQN